MKFYHEGLIPFIQQKASNVYIAMRALMELANSIMFTTYALYYVQALGLNPLQLVLVGTFLELVIFFWKSLQGSSLIRSAVDLSVILAFFIMGIAYVAEGSVLPLSRALGGAASLFVLVVASEMLRGVGETFLSGAQTAWIADEVGENALGRLFIRTNQVRQGAAITGVLLSVALSSLMLQLPYLVGGGLYLLIAVYLCVAMPEIAARKTEPEERRSWRDMGSTLNEGTRAVRGKPLLMLLLFVSLFLGAASEGFDRLWEAHSIQDIGLPALGALQPSVWFGIIGLCGMLFGIALNELVLRKVNLEDAKQLGRVLFIASALRIMLIASFVLAGNLVWAIASFWLLGMAGSVFHPAYDAWLNRHVPSRIRSTVLSFLSQSNALGQTVGGPFVGWVGLRGTIRASLLVSAALLLPILGLLVKAKSAEVDEDYLTESM